MIEQTLQWDLLRCHVWIFDRSIDCWTSNSLHIIYPTWCTQSLQLHRNTVYSYYVLLLENLCGALSVCLPIGGIFLFCSMSGYHSAPLLAFSLHMMFPFSSFTSLMCLQEQKITQVFSRNACEAFHTIGMGLVLFIRSFDTKLAPPISWKPFDL